MWGPPLLIRIVDREISGSAQGGIVKGESERKGYILAGRDRVANL
jgi:hypothetical protein